MDSHRYTHLFDAESREQLATINRALLDLEARPDAVAAVHELFRAVHSLKGMSASLGYHGVAAFAHEVETLLERVRSGARPIDGEVMDVLFAAADALEGGVERAASGAAEPPSSAEALARVRRAVAGAAVAAASADAALSDTPEAAARLDDGPGVLVRVRQRSGTIFPGVRAFMVLQKARALGDLVAVSPSIEELKSAEISQAFAFRLVTPLPPAAIESAVRAVGDVDHVMVLEGPGRQRAPLYMTPTDEPLSLPHATRYVRIEVSRLDRLVNLIAELAHERAELEQLTAGRREPALDAAIARTSRLIADLQGEVMASRLVPAWHLFDRFPRLVRDAARQLHKEIEFTIDGRDLEVDRFVLDEIGEPVVHLLRNAVDHGIEAPQVREAAGKPRAGRIVLSVARDAGRMAVRVRDDGAGIDAGRVLARARERGLVDAGVGELDDAALLRVLATPGFTLAASVSDLSGRGVGMDAVQARVRQLGGEIRLETAPGAGTTVTLRF
ncbi:MAG: Hpt domain-containing protein [Gemmatimonadetes bacterium]|nr:Hpt domain-containing protein [Gemmatimonadota bacterium]